MKNKRIMKRVELLTVIFLGAFSGPFVQAADVEPADPDTFANALPAPSDVADASLLKRAEWFQDARFGLFIHFGAYSSDKASEWPLHNRIRAAIQRGEDPEPIKKAAMEKFNPVDFDADAIVQLASDAGMRYVVFTAKHCDGFSNWATAETDFNVMNTPFGRDITKELAEACARHSLVFNPYFSVSDASEGIPCGGKMSVPDEYFTFVKNQLTELTDGRYGRVGLLWFDAGHCCPPIPEAVEFQKKTAEFALELRRQGKITMFNAGRIGKHVAQYADFGGGEWTKNQDIDPSQIRGGVQETCMTHNEHWGYAEKDENFKSAAVLKKVLAQFAAANMNLLLNIGPDDRGRVPEKQVEILRELADWMKPNGEAIHKTRGIGHYRTVSKDGKATYRFVLSWDDEPVTVTGIEHPVKRVKALDPAIELTGVEVRQEGETWTVTIPKPAKTDPDVTVIGMYAE